MVQSTCQHCTAYTRLSPTQCCRGLCSEQCIKESKRDSLRQCNISYGMITATGNISCIMSVFCFICKVTTASVEELFDSPLLSTLTTSIKMIKALFQIER